MTKRRILVLAPVWPNASELWMHRMTGLLSDETVGFATFAPRATHIAETVPTWDLLARWARPLAKRNITTLGFGIGSRRLLDLIRKLEVTHVLCHYATTAVHFRQVWTSTKVPVWVHCHGYDVTWTRRKMNGLPMREYQQLLCDLARRIRYLANSHFTKDRMVQVGIPGDRIDVKYIGVPADPNLPIRKHQGTKVEVLFLGRLVDFKGPIETIQAFEKAVDAGNFDGRLTLAGDGPLQQRCEAYWKNSPHRDRIRMLGAVTPEQGDELRAQSDLFTAHSCLGPETGQAEALGVAFVEAMFAGLPVVTGRYGGVCETVVHDETGLLFEPGNMREHAACLERLANDFNLRNRFARAARTRAETCFSLEEEKINLNKLLS